MPQTLYKKWLLVLQEQWKALTAPTVVHVTLLISLIIGTTWERDSLLLSLFPYCLFSAQQQRDSAKCESAQKYTQLLHFMYQYKTEFNFKK
jgi:hypothetical protein